MITQVLLTSSDPHALEVLLYMVLDETVCVFVGTMHKCCCSMLLQLI